MITYSSAIELIKGVQLERIIIEVDIIHALNHVCAASVFSPINFPPFSQSAMDGYALGSLNNESSYKVKNILKAGDSADLFFLQENEASRIFTGAMIPENTKAIVKQEDITVSEDSIILNKPIKENENIRFLGEQTKAGSLVLKENTTINSGTIGFLAMLGVFKLKVFKKPSIAIIATGNELVQKGEKLSAGKIYESNTYTLIAALNQFGFSADAFVVNDDKQKITELAKNKTDNYDLVLFTGGISVGDYDFVHEVLSALGVKEIFYKVRQKPGKPIFFGQHQNKLIFALPGNPAAVLTSFYVYVLEALAVLMGKNENQLHRRFLKLNENYTKSANLTCFLKGKCTLEEVQILRDQSSAMLSSFVESDCLIVLPEGKNDFCKNELVEVILIK
ncbi:MAG: molybdopterin molybdotransferase MoeA [Flavobacteriia bacterium]|jgi:molybdopterin molybdotransferase